MTDSFLKYIAEQKLFSENEKVLIAVSGGIDSTVLCHLFHQAKLNFGIAHCNFKLRGKESDEDTIFVKKLAEKIEVPFHSVEFETEKIAKERKQSIQVAARELRYDWLEKIRQSSDYQYIATAHHLNDSLETVLYNFTKGCGIRGLHGILPKNEFVIRPLLFATKEGIENFAETEKIEFRKDASNATDKYSRNKIRHHVVPILKDLNPAFEKTASENISRIRETEALFNYAVENLKKDIAIDILLGKTRNVRVMRIDGEKLLASPAPATLLFEILSPLKFNNHQVTQILQCLDNQIINSNGKHFFSSEWELGIYNGFLNLRQRYDEHKTEFKIENEYADFQFSGHNLIIKSRQKPPTDFPKNTQIAFFDESKIQFPLTLRRWKNGDFFHPFGMEGKRKKLQDFFTDLKLSRFEKKEVWILESGGQICWVVGYRTDERFKIDEKTESCLVLELTGAVS